MLLPCDLGSMVTQRPSQPSPHIAQVGVTWFPPGPSGFILFSHVDRDLTQFLSK